MLLLNFVVPDKFKPKKRGKISIFSRQNRIFPSKIDNLKFGHFEQVFLLSYEIWLIFRFPRSVSR
jgi:hypothetical protein